MSIYIYVCKEWTGTVIIHSIEFHIILYIYLSRETFDGIIILILLYCKNNRIEVRIMNKISPLQMNQNGGDYLNYYFVVFKVWILLYKN